MRRWVLWGAPVMILAGALPFAGGPGLALGGWMTLGALLPGRPPYPYQRKRRRGAHRLFFAWSTGCLTLYLSLAGIKWLCGLLALQGTFALLPALAGAALLALPVCQWALACPVPRMIAWAAGCAMSALSLLLLLSIR